MIEGGEQLIDSVRSECIAHFGSIEGDPNHTVPDRLVIRDVGELESRHLIP